MGYTFYIEVGVPGAFHLDFIKAWKITAKWHRIILKGATVVEIGKWIKLVLILVGYDMLF